MKKHAVTYAVLLTFFAAVAAMAIILTPARPKRYAVFAGFNPDGTLAPYVLDYLKGLNGISDGVVYIADSPLSAAERQKAAPYVIHAEYARHGEYDWGSYKRGYNWLKRHGYLQNADELIFANDSAYAPLKSFKPMFAAMEQRPELGFWGNTQNARFNPHLQSYFLVFRKKVLNSKSFATFINRVTIQPHHSLYITEYEVKLTPYLENLGYKWTSYIPDFPKPAASEDPNSYPLTAIAEYNSQFLKRRTFTDKLPIEESRAALLSWLEQNAPQAYRRIIADFPDSRQP